jgi:hypothetical protein
VISLVGVINPACFRPVSLNALGGTLKYKRFNQLP